MAMATRPNWRGTLITIPDQVETRLARVERIVPKIWRAQPTHARSRYDALPRTTITSLDATKANSADLAPVATQGTWSALTGSFAVSTPLNAQGSIVPGQAILVTFTFTSSSITLNWATQSLLQADNSYLTFHSGSQTFSSLSPSTTYYIYEYIRVSDGTGQFVNSTPPPTAPDLTMSAQTCLDGRIPIDAIKVTTAASSGSGGGSGGGGDLCPESQELVQVVDRGIIPVSQVAIGDLILGRHLTDLTAVYRKVISISSEPCAAWRMVDGHRVSPCEEVWYGERWIAAYRIPEAPLDETVGTKVKITVQSDEYAESNYELQSATPLVIHNMRPLPC